MTAAEKTRLLAERVMGWRIIDGGTCAVVYAKDGLIEMTHDLCKTWSPLTNLAHAGEVLEAMAKKGWSARIATNACAPTQNGCEFFRDYLGLGNDIFSGNYSKYGPDRRVCAVAETIPTAICHAALKTEGVKEEEL